MLWMVLPLLYIIPTTEPRVDYRLLGGADDSASALQDLEEHGNEEEEEKEEEDYTYKDEEEEEDYTFKDEVDAVKEFMEVTGESEDNVAVNYLSDVRIMLETPVLCTVKREVKEKVSAVKYISFYHPGDTRPNFYLHIFIKIRLLSRKGRRVSVA